MHVVFAESAGREWKRLPKSIQRRLENKLLFYSSQPDALKFAKPMIDSDYGHYRFRIGDYRLLFDVHNETIIILKVGHRREVYR